MGLHPADGNVQVGSDEAHPHQRLVHPPPQAGQVHVHRACESGAPHPEVTHPPAVLGLPAVSQKGASHRSSYNHQADGDDSRVGETLSPISCSAGRGCQMGGGGGAAGGSGGGLQCRRAQQGPPPSARALELAALSAVASPSSRSLRAARRSSSWPYPSEKVLLDVLDTFTSPVKAAAACGPPPPAVSPHLCRRRSRLRRRPRVPRTQSQDWRCFGTASQGGRVVTKAPGGYPATRVGSPDEALKEGLACDSAAQASSTCTGRSAWGQPGHSLESAKNSLATSPTPCHGTLICAERARSRRIWSTVAAEQL